MAGWLDSLHDHIVANNLGVEGHTLFVGGMDDTGQIEPVAALAPMNGLSHEVMGGGGIAIDEPALQLSVRGPSWQAAYDLARDIRLLLVAIHNETIQGTYFLRVAPSGTIRDLGRDANDRQMFTVEMDVWL